MSLLSGKHLVRNLAIISIAFGTLAGGLAMTNPSRSTYERYATQRLSSYLSRNLCTDLPTGLGGLLKQQCHQMLRANQDSLQSVIQHNTQTRDYYLFSIYYTQLAVPNLEALPAYRVATIGILNQFFTYKVVKQAATP